MTQEQILNLLKENPNKRFNVYDIAHSIPNGLARRIVHKNMESLEKLDCIKKEGDYWYYAERKN